MIFNNWQKWFGVMILLTAAMPLSVQACTTFLLGQDGKQVFGKNYDWHLGAGMVIINQRGVSKTAMQGIGSDPVEYASWISKYGSLTFNQYGREMPTGGMNEAGLVVHLMMLHETQYSKPDSRNPIKDLQWIQYQLDNFNSVEQVIQSNSNIRILYNEVPGLHYLVADKKGNCATFEWIKGRFVCHTEKRLPVKALTNNTYEDSLRYLRRHKGFGGKMPIDNTEFSLDRFVRAAHMLKNYQSRSGKTMVDYAFDILKNVLQGSTKWSIVYDLQELRVYFKTVSDQYVKIVDLMAFDLSCKGPVKVMNINSGLSGDVTGKFSNYTRKMNRKLIFLAMKGTSFVSDVPDDMLNYRVVYPETTTCDN